MHWTSSKQNKNSLSIEARSFVFEDHQFLSFSDPVLREDCRGLLEFVSVSQSNPDILFDKFQQFDGDIHSGDWKNSIRFEFREFVSYFELRAFATYRIDFGSETQKHKTENSVVNKSITFCWCPFELKSRTAQIDSKSQKNLLCSQTVSPNEAKILTQS